MAQPGKDGNFDIFSKLLGSGLKKSKETNEDEFKKKYEASQTQIETLKALVQQLLEENKSIKEDKETLQENFTNLCDAAKDQLEKKDNEIESLKKLLKEYEDTNKYTPLQEQDSGLCVYSSEESEKSLQKDKGDTHTIQSKESDKSTGTDGPAKAQEKPPYPEEATSSTKDTKQIYKSSEDKKETGRISEDIKLKSKNIVAPKEAKQVEKSYEDKRHKSTEALKEVKQTKRVNENVGQKSKSSDDAKEEKHSDGHKVDTKKQIEGQKCITIKPVDEKDAENNKRNEEIPKKAFDSRNAKKRKEMDTTSKDNDNKKQKIQSNADKVVPSANLKSFRIPKVRKSAEEKDTTESKSAEQNRNVEKTVTSSPAESLKRYRIPKRKKNLEENTVKTETIDKEKKILVGSPSSEDHNQDIMVKKMNTRLQVMEEGEHQKGAILVADAAEGSKKLERNKTSPGNKVVNAEKNRNNDESENSQPQAISVPSKYFPQSDKENLKKALDDSSKSLPSLLSTNISSEELTIQAENITKICELSEDVKDTFSGKTPDPILQVSESGKREKDGLKERNEVEPVPPTVPLLLQHVRSESYDKRDDIRRPKDEKRREEKTDLHRYRKKSRNYDTKPVSDGDRISSYLGVSRRRDRVEKEMLRGKRNRQQEFQKEEEMKDVHIDNDTTENDNVMTDVKENDNQQVVVSSTLCDKRTEHGNVATDGEEKDTQQDVVSSTLGDNGKEKSLKPDQRSCSSDEKQSSLEDSKISNEKVQRNQSECKAKKQKDENIKPKSGNPLVFSEVEKEKTPQDEEYMLAFGYGEDIIDEHNEHQSAAHDESAEIDYDDIIEFENSDQNAEESENKPSSVSKKDIDISNRMEDEDDMSKDGLLITEDVLSEPDIEQKKATENDSDEVISTTNDEEFKCTDNEKFSNLKTMDTQNDIESVLSKSVDSDTASSEADSSEATLCDEEPQPISPTQCATPLAVTPLSDIITPITSVKASKDREATTETLDNEEESMGYPGLQLFAPDVDSLLTEDTQGEYASPVKMPPREGLSKVTSPSKFEVARFLRRSPRKRKNTTEASSRVKKLQLDSKSKEKVPESVAEANVESEDKMTGESLNSTIEEGEITSESEEDIPKAAQQRKDEEKRHDRDHSKRGSQRSQRSTDEEKKKGHLSVSRSGREGNRSGRSDNKNATRNHKGSESVNRRDRYSKQTISNRKDNGPSGVRDASDSGGRSLEKGHRNKQTRTATNRDRDHTQKLGQRSSHEKDQSTDSTTRNRSRTSAIKGENISSRDFHGTHRQEQGTKRGENRRHMRSRTSDNRPNR